MSRLTAAADVAADTLTAADIQRHHALGIDSEVLWAARVRRVGDAAARDVLSARSAHIDFEGVEYPYLDPASGRQVTARVRLDHPPLKADGTADGKYRAPFGDNRHLYFPPGAGPLLSDTAVTVVIVESEKAALAVTSAAVRSQRRVLVIACGGCWGWRGSVGKDVDARGARVDVRGPLPDFGLVKWAGRSVVILFDARPNESVRAGRRALARELRTRNAEVLQGYLPDDAPGVNGPDDYIGAHGDQALWKLVDEAAPDEFVRTDTGSIAAGSIDNVRLALSTLGTHLRFDQFAQQLLIDGVPADDLAFDRLWVRIDDAFGFRPSRELLRTIVTTEAEPYHPVRDYLDGLEWDGRARLNDWLVTYGGAEPTDYVRAVSALPLIAAVRRVRSPGTKFDELLILESPQGTSKSTALRTLCPNDGWFSDDLPLGVDSKSTIERTGGKLLLEAAELHGNRGRETEALKAFLSRQVDGPVRLAYARFSVQVPRQFVLIGTTNSSTNYLKDATGARRFWPVSIVSFDVAALLADRDQLWAEASAREAAGESIGLHPALWCAAGRQQEARRASDPWEDLLEPLIEEAEVVAVDDIWHALGVEAKSRDNRHADRVASILQRHGFVEKRKLRRSTGGNPVWHWTRVPTEPSAVPGE